MIKSNVTVFIEFIDLIKRDKEGLEGYKDISNYYGFMAKICGSEKNNIVEFINYLITSRVQEYIEFDIEIDILVPLLDLQGELNKEWANWHSNIGLKSDVDNERFNEFRKKCFELETKSPGRGEILYRETRLFIINNPIIENANFIKNQLALKKVRVNERETAFEYLKQCYDFINIEKEYDVCCTCGYVLKYNNETSHNFCNGKQERKLLKRGTGIAREPIYTAFIKPGRFEVLCYEEIKKSEFDVILFPEIEKEGDILVVINENKIYLDMKAYNRTEELLKEIMGNSENGIKDKYKNRWIIVPELYYKEAEELLRNILNKYGSRLYSIPQLIQKLMRVRDEYASK